MIKPSIYTGFVFGIFVFINNIIIINFIKEKNLGIIFSSSLIFFCSYFSILFTKKKYNYIITLLDSIKCSVQSGIIMSIFYFVSIIFISKYINPSIFPKITYFSEYFLQLSFNVIIFSIISMVFGLILGNFLKSKES